ncbi:MAG: hypothetical protein LBS43_01975 [Prevotellaceae bacterium]|jgi:hypothetical protein|nr:hypothetical protein [Prevotellaceae bacterium]
MKEFNTSVPWNSTKHYMIEAATRLQGVEQLIDDDGGDVIRYMRQEMVVSTF